jgi:hypothetical protein
MRDPRRVAALRAGEIADHIFYELARRGATNMGVVVGWPVGEPPSGSTVTATWGALARACRCTAVRVRWAVPDVGNTPRETGLPPAGSAQSS